MDLFGRTLLLLTALVATSHCLPDGLRTLPDASVFEMKPPKEFLDLFKRDDSKNLTNPMKPPLIAAATGQNLKDVSKLLPDPSVFEMKAPKEFLDLFKLKEKDNLSVTKDKESLASTKKESFDVKIASGSDLPELTLDNMEPPKKSLGSTTKDIESPLTAAIVSQNTKFLPDPSVFEMKAPKEFLDLFKLKEKDNLSVTKDKESLATTKKESFDVKIASGSDLPELTLYNMEPPKKSLGSTTKDTESPLTAAIVSQNTKFLPDPSVFEMKAPKEFLDLFQLKEKDNLTVNKADKENLVSSKKEASGIKDLPKLTLGNVEPPKKSLDSTTKDTEALVRPMKETSGVKSTDLPGKKPLPDPSVFEMKPPKEFLELFQLNHKEDSDTPIKYTFSTVIPSHSLTDEKKTLPYQNVFEITEESATLSHLKKREKPLKSMRWPGWSIQRNYFDEKLKFPDEFYQLVSKSQENVKNDKHTETIESQKPHDIIWNQETSESHSYYHESPTGDKESKPLNTFTSNEGLSAFQNIQKEDDNDIQVRFNDDSKTIKHTKKDSLKLDKDKTKTNDVKIVKPSEEANSQASHKTSILPIEKISHDTKEVLTNKYADAIIHPKDNILDKKDTKEVKSVDSKLNDKVGSADKHEDKQSPPKISVLDNSIFVPVQLMSSPQSQPGFGNMVFMSQPYPSQTHGLPIFNVQMPNQAYGVLYTNQPNNQIHLNPHSLEVKPEAVTLSGNLEKESSSPSSAPQSVFDLLQPQGVKPSDLIISSIKHSSKDDPSSTHVAAMLVPSKTVPQTRSIISGNNMVINNGDKLENVDQTINSSPAPEALHGPSKGEPIKENNLPNMKPDTINQGSKPMNSPYQYPVFGSNGYMVSQSNKYPQNQPVFVNVPYGSNGVPLNYVYANGAPFNGQLVNTQNYQPNPGQGGVLQSPVVGGYNQNNLYALVPISNKPNPYFNNNVPSNGNTYQGTGQVFNLVPAHNNVLMTKDEEDL